jgi:hypothetical protein
MPIYCGINDPSLLQPDGYYSALDVYGPEIDGTACQQALDAVFFEDLLDCKTFNYDLYFPRTSGPSSPIASVRMVAKGPPAERLVQELSGKWPRHRFVLVKNGFYGAEPEIVEYQAGRVASPIVVEPDHPAEPSAGDRDATTTLPVTSPERGPGTAGLLSRAIQQLTRSYQLSEHVFLWQGQYASTEFFYKQTLAAKLDGCYGTIATLLDDDDRISFSQLEKEYEQRASEFTTKQEEADTLHDLLAILKEPRLLELLDHEGREAVGKATTALQSVRETLRLALRELSFN